jgi:hypothetical protein
MPGFIEVIVRRRRRGRPSRRRVMRVTLPAGIALEIGDRVPSAMVERVICAVLSEKPAC